MTAETEPTVHATGATGGSADDDGWVTAGRDHHHGQGRKSTDANRETTKPTAAGGGKWKEDGSSGASGGKREGSRRSKYGGGKDGWGKAEGEGGRERRDRDGRRDGWGGGKQWVDGDGGGKSAANGDSASAGVRADGGDGGRRAGTGRAQRDGIPTRPAGRGFTMGRGKNGGQALELSLGALKVSSVSDAFYESIVAKKAAKGQFADADADAETAAAGSSSEAKTEESAEPKKSTVTYRYDALEMVTILRQLEEANACVLPEDVCGTNVPLKTIKPGDALWELTMLGRHGDWSKTAAAAQSTMTAPPEPKTTGKSKDDNIPEWAQEGNSLADASITDDGFLGGTLPELTPEERLGLAGLAQPSNGAAAPQRTSSRFVALEEEETLMPHMSHIGNMMQPPPQQQQQQQQQQQPPPPMQMPPMRMPPQQQQQQQQQQQPPPVPMNVDWLYLDPQQQQQGPFSRQELIEWHQGGFFPNDLPCKPVDAPPGAPFMPLIELLQNGWRYGIPMQQPPPQQQQQQPQGGGLPPWLAQQGQQPPGGPPPPQMQAPRGRTLEEIEQSHGIARAPPQQGQQPPKTNVLANFAAGLGISSQAGAVPPAAKGMTLAELEGRHMHDQASRLEVASADASHKWDAPPAARDLPPAQMPPTQMPPTQMPPRPEPMPEPPKPSGPAWGGAAPAPPPQAAGKTLLDIQREEEARAAAAAKNAPPPNMNTAFGGAWGAGSAGSGKSLKQIQDEEAAATALRAAQAAEQQQAVATSGGWAAAAATGVVQPKPAPPAPRPMAVPRTVPAPRPAVAAPNFPAPLTPQPVAPSVAAPGGSPPLNDKNALRRWCKTQMSQLNNSDDMTLVDFLLGLPSAGEVQEYVALYLGKTPQATAFAAELIRQKRADPSLASGLGNGEMAKVAAQTGGSAAGGFTDDVDDDAGWSSASKKKGR